VDSNLDAATAYYYRVQAFNAAGSSAYSMLGTPPRLTATAAESLGGNLVLTGGRRGGFSSCRRRMN
jgi:hypothetical protein